MNFSFDDRHRSIRRHVMAAMQSPPWRVRLVREAVADDARPMAVVEASSPATHGRAARVSIPQGNVERVQTFAVMLYPAMGETPDEARLAAAEAAELWEQALAVGLVNDDGSSYAPPERIPVFDYSATPLTGSARGGPADPYGWAWVEDFPVRVMQDPDDPLRWTVACDLRLSWEQMGRVVEPADIAGGMHGGYTPPFIDDGLIVP